MILTFWQHKESIKCSFIKNSIIVSYSKLYLGLKTWAHFQSISYKSMSHPEVSMYIPCNLFIRNLVFIIAFQQWELNKIASLL